MAGEFNRLLKGAIRSVAAYEDKSPSEIDAELAEAVGLAPVTIRDYKGDRAPSSRIVVAGLARILVRRAYLDREWLVRFLNAAHYSLPESLINELFPDVAVPAPGPDILPPASYSHFVMRQQVFDEVVEALRQTTSILVITGLGGMGKTSLAREVAARCLQNASDLPQFEAVIWVSDAEQPGTTTLNIALDAIATTLDYPGITQLNYKTKKREVEKLLARQRSLLVIDSFETITDGELFDWLLSLPKSTKAIITTREYRREFRECRHVELRAMNETEAYQFIDLHLRLRGLQHLVNDRDQLNPLIAATGGNPKAILISLGRLKYEPIKDVIDDLRTGQGEPFDDLFKRCWDQLDQAARRVLLVMPLFRGSASKEALQTVADIQGFVFNRVVERLADLALLDVHQKDITSHPRYTLHPLVHAFVIAKLQKHSQLEEEMRSRWVEWVEDYVLQVGWAWDDLSRLKIAEAEEENIYAAINWAFRSHNDTATINIAQGIDHYYYVRGLWDKKKEVDKWRIEAAQRLGDLNEEARSIAQHVQILCRTEDLDEVERLLPRLRHLEQCRALNTDVHVQVQHAFVFYEMVIGELDKACQRLRRCLDDERCPSVNLSIATLHWLATCLYKKGLRAEAEEYFSRALSQAKDRKYYRSMIYCQLYLARIALDEENLEGAKGYLDFSMAMARACHERRYMAGLLLAYARLHKKRGNAFAARQAFAQACDLFERLILTRDDRDALDQTRAELRRIADNGGPDAHP